MEYEWDPNKADSNRRDHGIDFADVFGVFEDPYALTIDQIVRGEERHVTLGMDSFGRLLVVVYTWRGDIIRIISARTATRTEQRDYEKGI